MNKTTLIRNIKTAIEQGELDRALDLLQQLTNITSKSHWKNAAIALKARHANVERQYHQNLIDNSEAGRERSKITHAVLSLLEDIAEQDELGTATTTTSPTASSSIEQQHSGSGDNVAGDKIVNQSNTYTSPEKNKESTLPFTTMKWWQSVLAISVIISLFAGIAEISGYSLKDLFSSSSQENVTSNVTIKVRPKGDYDLPENGKVILNFGGEISSKTIGRQGEVYFPEVPNRYFSKDAKVKIAFEDPDKEPFKALNEDSLYQLKPNSVIDLWVELKGLDKLYGIVKDFETGNPVEGVRVSVLDLEAFTDKNGWFNLTIAKEKQKKFHTIRAIKEGYKMYEQQNVPAQTDEEMQILLKK